MVFQIDLGERLTVSKEAIIQAGPRRLVLIDRGEGRYQARELTTGVVADQGHEVLAGLEAGDRVVISANYLIAAESRLQTVITDW